ncbi:hypothetical protein ACQP2F_14515 [Actinoplanes sp. CA-030573]|uniref:hypothetical protein n=1 Tax=Actinoplanes sp. CA-030573 TaxID=3239898 RepID=UPI003D8FE71E
MHFTVIGVWLADKPAVAGVVAGDHEIYGGDEHVFADGLWSTVVEAADIREAEHLATTAILENSL